MFSFYHYRTPVKSFEKETESCSLDARYIPMYCYPIDSSHRIKDDIFIYGLPNPSEYQSNYYKNFINIFTGYHASFYILFYKEVIFKVSKGFIANEYNEPLLVVTASYNNFPNFNKILMSVDLYLPKYKFLYNKIFKEFILPFLEEEGNQMEVMSTKELKEALFNPIFPKSSEFNTLEEYEKYLTDTLSKDIIEKVELLVIQKRGEDTLLLLTDIVRDRYGYVLIKNKESLVEEIEELFNLPENILIPSKIIVENFIDRKAEEGLLELEDIEEIPGEEAPF